MVLADNTLFVAGPPDLIDEEEVSLTYSEEKTQAQLAQQEAALEGKHGAVLLAVDKSNGATLAQMKLKSLPVFDGLAAARGKLYMTTADGKVLCLSGR